jgi:hypothetical protein
MCRVIESNNTRYDIHDIINNIIVGGVLNPLYDNTKDKTILYTVQKPNDVDNTTFNDNLGLIKNRNIDALKEIINPQSEPIIFNSYNEIYDYLKKQDLQQFLGLPQRFCCIYHNDKNPSANIYKDKDTNYWWYKCFSPKCKVVKDIMSVTEWLTDLSIPKALEFLCKIYNIQYLETDWQKDQKEILDGNKRLLASDRFKIVAPETYQRIGKYINELYVLNDIAKDFVWTEKYATVDDNRALFFMNIKDIARICKKDKKNISNYLGLFTYLGLLDKLNNQQIPEELLDKAKHVAAQQRKKVKKKTGQDIFMYMVNYYSIPSYKDKVIFQSEQKSLEFKEKNFSMAGWGREMILRALGEEEANRVFPQLQGLDIKENHKIIAENIENIFLNMLDKQGYVTEKEIENSFNDKNIHIHVKRTIPELLDKYDLIRVRANKQIKEQYNIQSDGYPFIIIKNNK